MSNSWRRGNEHVHGVNAGKNEWYLCNRDLRIERINEWIDERVKKMNVWID